MEVETLTDKDGAAVTLVDGRIAYAVRETRNGRFAVRNDRVSGKEAVEGMAFEGTPVSFHPDRATAEADLLDALESRREKESLPRREIHHEVRTPSGMSDSATSYGEGVTFYGTPGHGYFKLDAKTNAKVAPTLRRKAGWYEEDVEWAIVTTVVPHLFTARERRKAMQQIKEYYPDEAATLTGVPVPVAESRTLREREFEAANGEKYVVVSASREGEQVRCTAALGGRGGDVKVFMVPGDEYAAGEFGFVIDESRHEELKPETFAM